MSDRPVNDPPEETVDSETTPASAGSSTYLPIATDGKYEDVDPKDFAGPDRSYPIRTPADIKDAWDLRGHAENPEAVGRKIVSIAKRKGFAVPESIKEEIMDKGYGTDAIRAPLPISHEWRRPHEIGVHPDFQFREDADLNGVTEKRRIKGNSYDVDKGGVLLCYADDDSGMCYVVDGHHRLDKARNAKRFTSSRLHGNDHTEVERLLPTRTMHSNTGWTYETAKEQGRVANEGGSVGIEEEPAKDSAVATETAIELLAEYTDAPVVDAEPATDEIIEELACDSADYQIVADASRGGLLTIRQRATRADAVNLNGRRYKRQHLMDARSRANGRAHAGAMLSELKHPDVVEVCKGNSCEQKYVDNPTAKTSRIDDIGEVEEDGWVWVTRTFLDTPVGRKIKKAVDEGKKIGISMRFVWRCHKAKDGVDESDWIEIYTFDDVDNPAFTGTKEGIKVVTDDVDSEPSWISKVNSQVGLVPNDPWQGGPQTYKEGLGYPFLGINRNMAGPPETQTKSEYYNDVGEPDDAKQAEDDILHVRPKWALRSDPNRMNTGIVRLLNDLQKAVVDKADACTVKAKTDAVVTGISKIIKAKGDYVTPIKALKQACLDMEVEGYEGEKLYAESGAELGNLINVPSWGEDLEKWEGGFPRFVDKITTTKPKPDAKIERDAKDHPADCDCKDCVAERKGPPDAKKDAEKKPEEDKRKMEEDKREPEEDEEEKKDKEHMRKMRMDAERKKEEEGRKEKIEEALKDAEKEHEEDMKEMEEHEKDSVRKFVRTHAKDSASVPSMLQGLLTVSPRTDEGSAREARKRLENLNLSTDVKGTTVTVKHEARPSSGMAAKLSAMADEWLQAGFDQYGIAPNTKEQQVLRGVNRRQIQPLLDDAMVQLSKIKTMDQAYNFAVDNTRDEEAEIQELCTGLINMLSAKQDNRAVAASDATTMTQLWNQPTIAEWFLVQGFQDLQQLPNVRVIPPTGAGGANWLRAGLSGGRVGSTLRVMTEYWQDGQNYTYQSGSYDAGGLIPDGTALEYGSVNTNWQEYGTFMREFAFAVSMSAILQMGHGPLNYPAVMRSIFHVAARMSRARDKALADEQFNFATEYNAVAVSSEVYGTTPLADNSVGPASGAVTVNLNPNKTAVTAVAAASGYATADPFITYAATVPSAAPATATAIVAALRLKCGGNGTSAPYVGNATGIGQIVRPRTSRTISNSNGQVSSTTTNPISITSPTAQVLGNYDPINKVILNPTSGGSATYAIDYNNSCVVFNSAAGLTLSGGVITTSITISYTYATNYDQLVVDPYYFASTIGSQSVESYDNNLVRQFDATAATIAGVNNFVKPDLAMMDISLANILLGANLFYKLNSPKGTELFPEELYVAERNGINVQRINAPWNGVNQWVLESRRQTTVLGLDTPTQIRGPIDVQTSSGIVNQLAYIAYENEVINTPVPTNQSNVVINQPSRLIRCYKVAASTY